MMTMDPDFFEKHRKVHKKLGQAYASGAINGPQYQDLCAMADSTDTENILVVDLILDKTINNLEESYGTSQKFNS